MEILFKASGILLLSCCAVLIIRKSNPELALGLSIGSIALLVAAALLIVRPLAEMGEKLRTLFGLGDVYLLPLFKCCAAALTARLTADLCRDASQSASASAVEFLGVLCALAAAFPLIENMLRAIGEML